MNARCSTPSADVHGNYRGRGICVAPEWTGPDGFERFFAHIGARPSARHSVDRYPNNDGNYEPGNVRWATATEQARNRRSNLRVTIDGVSKSVAEWAEQASVSAFAIRWRLARGWSASDAVFKPDTRR